MSGKASAYMSSAAVASYRETAPLKVPGLFDLHRMAMLLLSEQAHDAARILVIGAGGGMETLALAQAQPKWRFTGVDPSAAMLELARRTLEPIADRVELIEGTVDQVPTDAFDGATCILTLHHIAHDERLRTLREIRRRLHPGARLVVAGHSAPGPDPKRWMTRSVAFGDRATLDWDASAATARMMTEKLPLLTPDQEVDVLRAAGFVDVALFYAAFSFRGWVATA
jgi:tRNA (cmo5U34)-methyltransferase